MFASRTTFRTIALAVAATLGAFSFDAGVGAPAAALAQAAAPASRDFAGTFTGTFGDGQFRATVVLREENGKWVGTITVIEDGQSMSMKVSDGTVSDAGVLTANVSSEDGEKMQITATLKGDTLAITEEGETVLFQRQGTVAPTTSPATAPSTQAADDDATDDDQPAQAVEFKTIHPAGAIWSIDAPAGFVGGGDAANFTITAPGALAAFVSQKELPASTDAWTSQSAFEKLVKAPAARFVTFTDGQPVSRDLIGGVADGYACQGTMKGQDGTLTYMTFLVVVHEGKAVILTLHSPSAELTGQAAMIQLRFKRSFKITAA